MVRGNGGLWGSGTKMMETNNLMTRNQEYLNISNLNCGPNVVPDFSNSSP